MDSQSKPQPNVIKQRVNEGAKHGKLLNDIFIGRKTLNTFDYKSICDPPVGIGALSRDPIMSVKCILPSHRPVNHCFY